MTDIQNKNYIIALDQGTTSSRAIIFDRDANVVCTAQREFTQHYPQAGWVEHDPMEIFATQSAVMVEALAQAGLHHDQVAAIVIGRRIGVLDVILVRWFACRASPLADVSNVLRAAADEDLVVTDH